MKFFIWLAVALTAILFGAKLAGAIACSWWVVFVPLLIVFVIWLLLLLIALAIVGIVALVALLSDK